jgi:pimeloyl-ACP methyl ester carboxylesterase
VTAAAEIRPVWLATEPDPALAVLHLPSPEHRRSTAVLMCPPFGWEEVCSYRARRTWAQAIAGAGFPVARLTLPSAGDSAGSPGDPGRMEAWTEAIETAAGWLRGATGASRLATLGIGLGGMLAYAATARGAPIDDLALCATPARGRTLLRELRAHAAMIAARYPDDTPSPDLQDGDLELIGFLMSAQTASELGRIDLRQTPLPDPSGRRVLLLERDGLSADRQLREHLEELGVSLSIEGAPDYGAMMVNPQDARTPEQTVARSVAWLQDAAAPAPPATVSGPATEHESIELIHDGVAIRETPLLLDGEMFGVLSESAESEPAEVCAVLLNGGALGHVGPNRTYVEIARRWAARRVPAVRVDLLGVGEAGGEDRALLPNPALYARERTEQTLSVLDQLSALGLPERFVLSGLCSGAYWSLHAALADPRVVGAMMINLYAFFWTAELVAERDTQESFGQLRGPGWGRLIRGDVSAEKLKSVILSMRPGRIRAGARHPVERAQSAEVERALDTLRDQGTEALLLFSRGEGLYDQLARQGVLDRLEDWPNLAVEQIPTRDHMFRALWLQRHVHEALDRGLERVLGAVSAGPPVA